MKRMLTGLMFLPLASFAMEQKEEHFVYTIPRMDDGEGQMNIPVNVYSKEIVIDRENLAFLNWGTNVEVKDSLDTCGKCETYCALTMRLSRADQAYKHKANIYHLNKKVGTKFPMLNTHSVEEYSYTVMCSLLEMANNTANIEYSVTLESDQVITDKIPVPMNGSGSANLKFNDDLFPITLELAVKRQNE